jgi:hypothetical protein
MTMKIQTSRSVRAVMVALMLTGAPTALAQHLGNGGLRGTTWQPFPNNGSHLLSRFYFRFDSTDHPLSQIALRPQPDGYAMVAFSDRDPTSSDDSYWYSADFNAVNSVTSVTDWNHFCGGYCWYALTAKPTPDSVFVVRGFRFAYAGSDDYAVKEITLLESNGFLYAKLNDRSNIRSFFLDLSYAWVPGWQIREQSTLSGTSGGAFQRSTPSGTGVLRGFSLVFSNDDYRPRELGVLLSYPSSGNMQVYFSDNSGSRPFSYTVNAAYLW